MKKLLLILTAVMLATALPACKKEDRPVFGNKPVVDVSQEEEIKIGVITSGNGESDNAYVQSHLQGIEAMRLSLGLSDEQISIKTDVGTDDAAGIRAAAESCVQEGCKVIFATEAEYEPVIAKLAAKYPDVVFSNALSEENNGKNLCGYTVTTMYQAQYLSGVVAGYNTDTGLVGYVAYEGSDMARAGVNAFAMGVEKINPEARVYVRTVESRCDSQAEKAAAEALLNIGCDIVGQNTFSSAPLTAAAEAGQRGCGFVTDMTALAPKAHLQAPVLNWALYYTRTVKNVIEDKWENENFVGGMGDGFINLSPVTHNCKRGTTAAVNQARDELMAGREVFTGPIVDDTGALICNEGAALTDESIFGAMDWRYRNTVYLE